MRNYIALLLIIIAPAIAHAGAFDLLDKGLNTSVVDVTAGIQSTAIICTLGHNSTSRLFLCDK